MSFESFDAENLIILVAIGWFGGLIALANFSTRSKRGGTTVRQILEAPGMKTPIEDKTNTKI